MIIYRLLNIHSHLYPIIEWILPQVQISEAKSAEKHVSCIHHFGEEFFPVVIGEFEPAVVLYRQLSGHIVEHK